MGNFNGKAVNLIWNIAEILRGSWKEHEYQDVVLPLVVIKRLDSILAKNKAQVLAQYDHFKNKVDIEPILKAASGVGFYNISPYDFTRLLDEPNQVPQNFRTYLNGFSDNIKDILVKFDFDRQLERLEGGKLLFLIISELNKVDLHPDSVDNHEMGQIFEELLRRFSEMSNETAGEHYTPREVIRLMVEVLFAPDIDKLKKPHVIKTIYDCACGTGGMLTVGKNYIKEFINPAADIYLYGQELNPATFAMCKSDMLIQGEDPDKIKGGEKDHSQASTLSNDQFYSDQFDYLLTNPPFGVDWKKDKEAVESESSRGFAGRFGAGTPRISDGQLLFLQHMISKMRNPIDGGSRLAIVFNGSPLFTGDAGSGESEIRRWILEHDWLETIIALPDQLFYNTGISTYLWFLTNRKEEKRKGKVQLIDARNFFEKTRKSLGEKRKFISDANRQKIVDLSTQFSESEYSKIFNTTVFAYRQIVVERPLRLNFQIGEERLKVLRENKQFDIKWEVLSEFGDKKYFNREKFLSELQQFLKSKQIKVSATQLKVIYQSLSERDEAADICLDSDGQPEPDSELRDTENVSWGTDVNDYFTKEVKPYVSDAWINESVRDEKDGQVGKVGYEIPFTRYFYKYIPPRDLPEIEADIEKVENELLDLLKQL